MKDGWYGQVYWINGIKRAKVERSGGFHYCILYNNEGREDYRDCRDIRFLRQYTCALARAWCERKLEKERG